MPFKRYELEQAAQPYSVCSAIGICHIQVRDMTAFFYILQLHFQCPFPELLFLPIGFLTDTQAQLPRGILGPPAPTFHLAIQNSMIVHRSFSRPTRIVFRYRVRSGSDADCVSHSSQVPITFSRSYGHSSHCFCSWGSCKQGLLPNMLSNAVCSAHLGELRMYSWHISWNVQAQLHRVCFAQCLSQEHVH